MESARIADMQELCNLLIDNGYRLVKVTEANMTEKMIDEVSPELEKTASDSGSEPALGFSHFSASDLRLSPVTDSGYDPFGDARCNDFQTVGSFDAESENAIQEDPILEKELQQARRRAELIRLEQEVDNPKLVSSLRKWRRSKAESQNVPAFYVLSNKTLLMIALTAPSTMEELLSVKGFGPVLAEKYGQELLDLIAEEMEVEEVDSPLKE